MDSQRSATCWGGRTPLSGTCRTPGWWLAQQGWRPLSAAAHHIELQVLLWKSECIRLRIGLELAVATSWRTTADEHDDQRCLAVAPAPATLRLAQLSLEVKTAAVSSDVAERPIPVAKLTSAVSEAGCRRQVRRLPSHAAMTLGCHPGSAAGAAAMQACQSSRPLQPQLVHR